MTLTIYISGITTVSYYVSYAGIENFQAMPTHGTVRLRFVKSLVIMQNFQFGHGILGNVIARFVDNDLIFITCLVMSILIAPSCTR